jgi:hypothetical protein
LAYIVILRLSFIVAVIWCLPLPLLGCRSSSVLSDGGTGGEASEAGMGGRGGAGGVLAGRAWAEWPMPNPPASALPNPQNYTILTVGSEAVVRDEVTRLVWQRRLDPRRFTWKDAMAYCDVLTLAGWDDWRLPSRIELVSLLNLGRTNPSIDIAAFPDTPGEWFWTASRQANDEGRAWFVYFYFGYPDTDPDGNTYPARCVR